jgi:hypothetical protein
MVGVKASQQTAMPQLLWQVSVATERVWWQVAGHASRAEQQPGQQQKQVQLTSAPAFFSAPALCGRPGQVRTPAASLAASHSRATKLTCIKWSIQFFIRLMSAATGPPAAAQQQGQTLAFCYSQSALATLQYRLHACASGTAYHLPACLPPSALVPSIASTSALRFPALAAW